MANFIQNISRPSGPKVELTETEQELINTSSAPFVVKNIYDVGDGRISIRAGVEMNSDLVRMLEAGETIEALELAYSRENIPRYKTKDGWISGRVLVDKVLGQATLLILKEPTVASSSPLGAKKLLSSMTSSVANSVQNSNLKDKMKSVSTNWFTAAKTLTATKDSQNTSTDVTESLTDSGGGDPLSALSSASSSGGRQVTDKSARPLTLPDVDAAKTALKDELNKYRKTVNQNLEVDAAKLMKRASILFRGKSNVPEDTSDPTGAAKTAPSTTKVSSPANGDVMEMFEHERWRDEIGWGPGNLEMGDPLRYTSRLSSSDEFVDAVLPEGWMFCENSAWKVDMGVPSSENGWVSAPSFRHLDNPVWAQSVHVESMKHLVRRKRWVRDIQQIDSEMDTVAGGVENNSLASKIARAFLKTKNRAKQESKSPDDDSSGDETQSAVGEDEEVRSSRRRGDDFEANRGTFVSELLHMSKGSLDSKFGVVSDPTLSAIGRQLRQIETECKKEDDANSKEWKAHNLPSLKSMVKELEKRISLLSNKIKSESVIGAHHEKMLKEEYMTASEVLESTKRSIYFPDSSISFGEGGIYVGMDDIWLQHISGQFVVDLVCNNQVPQIIVMLTGIESGADSGVSLRVKVEGFQLKSDSGKGVPDISLEEVKVSTVLRVTSMLTFDSQQCKWIASNQNFSMELISFKGPYGLSKGIVSSIINMVTPQIRSSIIDKLPVEFGLAIGSLPSPFSIRGEFCITGTDLNYLSENIHESNYLCSLTGYSKETLSKFMAVQSSMERFDIKSVQDFLRYRKIGLKHNKHWDQIKFLWNQAVLVYNNLSDGTELDNIFSFDRLSQAFEELMKKPLSIDVSLKSLDGHFSIKELLEILRTVLHRRDPANTAVSDDTDVVRLMAFLDILKDQIKKGETLIHLAGQNLDFMRLKLAFDFKSGPESNINVKLNNIITQIPLSVWINAPKEFSLGFRSPVPFTMTMAPTSDGTIHLDVSHLGSKKLAKRSTYKTFRDNLKQMSALSESEGAGHKPKMEISAFDLQGGDAPYLLQNIYDEGDGRISVRKGVDMSNNIVRMLEAGEIVEAFEFALTKESIPRYRISDGWISGRVLIDGVLGKRTLLVLREPSAKLNNLLPEMQAEVSKTKLRDILKPRKDRKYVDRLLHVQIHRPYASVIVDQKATLLPGTELLSFRMGPIPTDWRPAGFEGYPAHIRPSAAELSGEKSSNENANKKGSMATLEDCPIFIQTGNFIKAVVKVPEVIVDLHVPRLFRFAHSFLKNVDALKLFLGITTVEVSDEMDEKIELLKMCLDRGGKYVLLPEFDLKINMTIMVRASSEDLVLKFEGYTSDTPEVTIDQSPNKTDVINLNARLNFMDILADMRALNNSFVTLKRYYENRKIEEMEKKREEDEKNA